MRHRTFSCMFNLLISSRERPVACKNRSSASANALARAVAALPGSSLHSPAAALKISLSLSGPASSAKLAAAASKGAAAPRNLSNTAATSRSAIATSTSKRMSRHCSSSRPCTTLSMRPPCLRTSRSSTSKMLRRSAVVTGLEAPPPATRPYVARRWPRSRETFAASWSLGSNASSLAMRGKCCANDPKASSGGPLASAPNPSCCGAMSFSRSSPTAALKGEAWLGAQKLEATKFSRSSTVQIGSAWPCNPPGANICRRMSASSCSSSARSKNALKFPNWSLYSRCCTSVSCVRMYISLGSRSPAASRTFKTSTT
mmetsp:Transcript_6851/g.18940  ORF Transcript_6851/g.18940 Transcript_6851/m.18940 type:complete len:315 (+) Transcript_6851:326-1270(+)